MSEYIKREDALNIDFRCNVRMFESRLKTAERAVRAYADAIAELPAADVVDRKKGEWIPLFPIVCDRPYCYECSICGSTTGRMTNFCQNCGADMRKDGES